MLHMKDHVIFVGQALHFSKSKPGFVLELIEKDSERAIAAFSAVSEYYRKKFMLAHPTAYFKLAAQDTLHRLALSSAATTEPRTISSYINQIEDSVQASSLLKENQFKKYQLEDDDSQEVREKALRRAAAKGNLEDLLYFSTLVENFDSQDNGIKKQTAFHHAAKGGFIDCVEFLGTLGARWNIPDASGETAEELIKNSKNSGLLKTFTKIEQERMLQEPEAETWLQNIIFVSKIMILAKSNSDEAINIINQKGEAAVYSFIHTHLIFIYMLATLDINVFHALVNQAKKSLGLTMLANLGSTMLDVKLHVNRVFDTYGTFADLSLSENEKHSAIFRRAAAANDISATFSLMALKEIDINLQDSNPDKKRTALHWAILKNGKECARILIGAGAKTDILDANGKTAEDYARESGQEALYSLFENKSARAAFKAR